MWDLNWQTLSEGNGNAEMAGLGALRAMVLLRTPGTVRFEGGDEIVDIVVDGAGSVLLDASNDGARRWGNVIRRSALQTLI